MKALSVNRKAIVCGCVAGLVGAGIGVHLTQDDVEPTRAVRRVGSPSGAREAERPAIADGPTEVALHYVLNGQQLLDAGPDRVDELLAPLVAPGARDRLVDENRRDVLRVDAELAGASGPIVWRQAPLAVRASAEGDVATVAVWHVGVLSAPGVAPPQSHWSTSTVQLSRTDGEWRVTAETAIDGPVPLNPGDSTPVTSAELDAALTGFGSVDAE
jgi:hypothetical protein